jgi:hypothetical protein
VGLVKSNHHLSELGKASFSRKYPGRVTVFLRREAARAPAGGAALAAAPAAAGGAVEGFVLVPRAYQLDGGSEAADAFISALQGAVAALQP